MDVVIESYGNEKAYAELEIIRRWETNTYVVKLFDCINGEPIGYPINQMAYPISDKKKAYATYRRYKKKCLEKGVLEND